MRTMDTGSDAFNCSMAWEPELDEELDEITSPYGYQECGVYLGGLLQMVGTLYNVKHISSPTGITKDLEIYTKTADIIDSTIMPPYEVSNMSLTERCKQQCEPYGIDVVIGDGVNLITERRVVVRRFIKGRPKPREIPPELLQMEEILGAFATPDPAVATKGTWKVTGTKTIKEEQKFARISAKQTDKVFDHLKDLAAQVGLLLSCTKWGDLIITKANTEATPVGTIEEINPIADSYNASFKGRDRFSVYRSIASSSKSSKTASASIARDPVVTSPRIMTFRAPNNLPGEALSAADWRKNKSAADAMTLPFPVNSWYAPNGKLWEPNTTVTVISPVIGIKTGFTFLINKVEFVYKADGISANLELKPPTVYTTGQIEEPWIVDTI